MAKPEDSAEARALLKLGRGSLGSLAERDGTLELKEPLTGPRLTLIGEVHRSADQQADKARYLEVHPEAALYAGFGDFKLYRFRISEGLFVAGFGRIFRLKPEELKG